MKSLILTMLLVILSACDSSNTSPYSEQPVLEVSENLISGGITKGVLVGATVNAYPLAQDGSADLSNSVATAQTDNNGLFNLAIAADHGYLLLISSGGEFIDETDQNPNINDRRKISFNSEQGLKAVLPPELETIALTMTTQAIYEKSMRERGNDFYSVYQANLQNFSTGLGFNPLSTLSADPSNPAPDATDAAKQYALLSGGLANIVNQVAISVGYPLPNYQIIMLVIKDLSDGKIDGMLNGEALTININDQTHTLPTNLNLDETINRFKNNNFQNFESTPLPIINYELLESTGQLNNPPSLTITGVTNSPAGEPIELIANATDDDGTVESYLWQQTSGTLLSLSGENTSHLSFNAPVLAISESATFSVEVIDNSGLKATSTHTVTFEPAILLGVSADVDQQVHSNEIVTLNGSVISAPYVTVASINWLQTSGDPVTLSDPTSLSGLTFTAPILSVDTDFEFELKITDNLDRVVTDSVTISVLANQIPIVDAGADQVVYENTLVNLSSTAVDLDGSIVSHVWSHNSAFNISFQDANALNTSFIAPDVTSDTVITLILTATDNFGAQSTDTVNISILYSPVSVMISASSTSVFQTENVVLTATAILESGRSIVSQQWSVISDSDISLSSFNSLTTSFTAPNVSVNTVLEFSFTIIDDLNNQATANVSIIVKPNLPPQISVTSSQSVFSGDQVNINVVVTDPENDEFTVLWKQTRGTLVYLSGKQTQMLTFTAPSVEALATLEFNVLVEDALGHRVTELANVNVSPSTNTPPSIESGVEYNLLPNETISITANASSSDGTIVSYFWEQISPVTGAIDNINSATINFVAPDVSQKETIELRVTATDSHGATALAVYTITVDPNPLRISELTFNDTSLLSCVQNTASQINATFAYELTSIDCSSKGISDLTGIDQLTGLKEAVFENNSITDLMPLSTLTTLNKLKLGNNPLINIEALANISSLSVLGLEQTGLTTLSIFDNFNNILGLNISDNLGITDLTPLTPFTEIQFLNISKTSVNNLSVLTNFRVLETLIIENLNINSISFISNAKNLKTFKARFNNISNLSPLSSLHNLQEVLLQDNAIVTTSSLNNLTKIITLDLGNNNISDISGLNNLINMKRLWLGVNNLTVISPLFSLTGLDYLDIINNPDMDCLDVDDLVAALTTTEIHKDSQCVFRETLQ